VQNDLRAQVAPIHARSQARFLAREAQLRTQFSAPAGPLIAANGKNGAVVNPNLPPALREKIAHLHDDYAKAFQHDAGATIADFKKTREMLKKRYDALTGMNDEAARDVAGEIASLQRKREELYDQMVAQIGREVQTVARAHGVSVVVSDVAAAAGGIDLTADAKKDIETLHE
jgi:Skp family chaperone for outer membrane proteins